MDHLLYCFTIYSHLNGGVKCLVTRKLLQLLSSCDQLLAGSIGMEESEQATLEPKPVWRDPLQADDSKTLTS